MLFIMAPSILRTRDFNPPDRKNDKEKVIKFSHVFYITAALVKSTLVFERFRLVLRTSFSFKSPKFHDPFDDTLTAACLPQAAKGLVHLDS